MAQTMHSKRRVRERVARCRRRLWPLTLALAVLLAAPFVRQAVAHPHVWIDAVASLIMRDGAIEALQVSWTFDVFYSTLIREDYDNDGDGTLGAAELALIAQNQAAEDLASVSYFTYIKVGDQRLTVDSVEDFRAAFSDDRLTLTFNVPMPFKVDPAVTPFAFSLHDPSYYIDIGISRRTPVEYVGDAPNGCQAVVVEDEDNPIYFGMVYPLQVQLRCDVG